MNQRWITALLDRTLHGGRLPTLLPPKAIYPAVGGVFFAQSSVSKTGPVRVGITGNISEHMKVLQAKSAQPIRLLHYQVIDDPLARETCKREFYDLYASFIIKRDWFKFEIMQQVKPLEVEVKAVPEAPATPLQQMLNMYGIRLPQRDQKR